MSEREFLYNLFSYHLFDLIYIDMKLNIISSARDNNNLSLDTSSLLSASRFLLNKLSSLSITGSDTYAIEINKW